jgi:outer membrane immunogenic protein
MKRFLLATAALVALAAPAAAADMPVKAPPAVVATVFNWTGFYLGGDVGFIRGNTRIRNVGAAVLDATPHPDGIVGSVHGGYRYQFANRFVLGVEADFSFMDAEDNAPYNQGFFADARIKLRHSYSARGIGGFAWDRTLFYATGGASWLRYQGCETNSHADQSCFVGIPVQRTTAPGWVVGGGVAYALTTNLIARVEYLHADYGTRNLASPGFGNGITNYRVRTDTIRGGLSFKFGEGPVVARY